MCRDRGGGSLAMMPALPELESVVSYVHTLERPVHDPGDGGRAFTRSYARAIRLLAVQAKRYLASSPCNRTYSEATGGHVRSYGGPVTNINPSAVGPIFGLAFLSGPTETAAAEIKFDVELTEQDYVLASKALSPFGRIGKRDMYDLVVRNYRDIESRNMYYIKLFGLIQGAGRISGRDAAMGFTTACINWLNVVRLFLDHEQTFLSRSFGKTSPQLTEFKAACSEAFDQSAAYRFLYELRNYATHCGPPVNTVSVQKPSSEESAAGLKQRITFQLNRDLLLSQYDWGKHATPDLKAMDAKFELLPLIREATHHFWNIMRAVAKIDIKDAMANLSLVEGLLDRMSSTEEGAGQPCLLRMVHNSRGAFDFTPTPIPVEAIARLRRIDPSGDVLEPLLSDEPMLPARPPLSQHTKYRMERGALILSTRLIEGGGTPRFTQLVNQLIAEDGDIEPVISGLSIMGITLVQTSALAMQTTPESVLSSFAGGPEELESI